LRAALKPFWLTSLLLRAVVAVGVMHRLVLVAEAVEQAAIERVREPLAAEHLLSLRLMLLLGLLTPLLLVLAAMEALRVKIKD
jgi:hypothetical protein